MINSNLKPKDKKQELIWNNHLNGDGMQNRVKLHQKAKEYYKTVRQLRLSLPSKKHHELRFTLLENQMLKKKELHFNRVSIQDLLSKEHDL